MNLRAIAFACLSLLGMMVPALSAPSTAPRLAPLPLEDALKVRQFSQFTSPSVSPDGRYVVYSIQDTGRADRPIWGTSGRMLTETGADLGAYGSDVYVTDLRTSETINISGSVGTSYYGAWSPDSQQVAFYSDRDGQMRVWTWEVRSRALRRVSDAIALPNAPLAPLWGDAGRQLLVSLLPEGTTFLDAERHRMGQTQPVEPHFKKSTVSLYAHERTEGEISAEAQRSQGYDGYSRPVVKDLAQMEVATGEYKRLFRSFSGNLLGVSADGRYALTTLPSRADGKNYNDTLYSIVVLDMASGREAMTIPDVPLLWGISLSWAPSGYRFAYITGSRAEWDSPFFQSGAKGPRRAGDIFVADVGGEPINVSPGEHPSFSTGDAPIWSVDGRGIFAMAGGAVWRADVEQRAVRAVARPDADRSFMKIAAFKNRTQLWQPRGANQMFVLASHSKTKHEELDVVDLTTGAISPVLRAAQSYTGGYTGNFLFDAAGSTAPAVFAAMSATKPIDLYVTENFSRTRRLTELNPVFGQYVMGETRLVTWQGKDGKDYRGTLLLPAGYRAGRRYPMVVWQRPSNIGSMALDVFGLCPPRIISCSPRAGTLCFILIFPHTVPAKCGRSHRMSCFQGSTK